MKATQKNKIDFKAKSLFRFKKSGSAGFFPTFETTSSDTTTITSTTTSHPYSFIR